MKFFKRVGRAFHTRTGAYVFFALAAAAFVFLYSSKWAYGWIAELYPLGENFVPTLFCAIGLCAAVTFCCLLVTTLMGNKIKTSRIFTVFAVLTGILCGYTTVLLFGFDKGIDPASLKNGLASLLPNLPLLAVLMGLPFAFVVYPTLKKAARAVLALLISAAVLIPLWFAYAPPKTPFALSANPLVLDVGGDNYSVVFATNRESAAYLIYTTGDTGEGITLPDAASGRMNIGRIHHFIVPREELNGGSYCVLAREVLSSVNAITEYGAVLESETFQFQGAYKNALNILIATDWHDMPDNLLAAAANFPAPDLFLMLGDFASNYNSEDEFIRNTIAAGADITKSAVPAIYVRGNHELYGEKTQIIFQNLGLERFYYQVQRGKYLFTLCDGGGGWADQTDIGAANVSGSVHSLGFLDDELTWLGSLPVPAEDVFHLAAIHIPNFDEGNEARRALFFGKLRRLRVGMQFSGHEHALHLDAPGTGDYAPPHPLFVAGGPKDGGYSGTYVCSMAQVAADGSIHLTAFDSEGEKLMDETLGIGANP